MAQRVYSSQKMLEEKNNQAQNSGSFAKAEFVNLKPDAQTGETVKNLRIIGFPIRYRQFTDKKRKEGEKNSFVKVPFPDAHLNSNFTRIGTGGDPAYGECPWHALGYVGSWRYAVNVLERQKDGTSVVKILEKGAMIFNKLMEYETSNRELNSENPDEEPSCVMLGGTVAHDVRIKAKANPATLGGVDYVVSVNPKRSVITEEEIELLRAIGMPKPEDIAAERAQYELDRKNDPQLPEWEDWFLYGYSVDKIFKPTPIKVESNEATENVIEVTDSSELEISEPEPVAVATTAKPASKKASKAPVEANPFEDDEEEGGVAVATSDEELDW